MKKLSINMDTVFLLGLVAAGSLGLNAWLLVQNRSLSADYLDGVAQGYDIKANLVYARTLLKQCDPEKYAGLKVDEGIPDAGP
jgi:hypothetical protein